MAQEVIGTGIVDDDGKGDILKYGFIKVNNNFTELYSNVGNLQTDLITLAYNTQQEEIVIFTVANSAFDEANAAFFQGNLSYVQANNAFDRANGAFLKANSTVVADATNAAFSVANAAFNKANAANVLACTSFDQANTGYTKANAANVLAYSANTLANVAYYLALAAANQKPLGGEAIVISGTANTVVNLNMLANTTANATPEIGRAHV